MLIRDPRVSFFRKQKNWIDTIVNCWLISKKSLESGLYYIFTADPFEGKILGPYK